MDRGLQEIVDALSLSLGRPVLIDDAELRPLAYSTQFGELDDVRTASILGRHAPDDARVALFDEGIRTAAGPVHIPARPDIGMRARVCVPLVGGGRRLGYLWLFEEPPVTEAELRLARAAAAEAAALVGPDADAQLLRRRHEQQLVDLAAQRRSAPGRDRRGRARGRALPAAAAGLRVGRRARRPGGGRVERGGAGPAARAAGGQAGAVRGVRRPAGLPRRRARACRQRGDGGARRADRAAGAGRSGRGRRGPARGRARRYRRALAALRVAAHEESGTASWDALGVERVVTALPDAALEDLPEGLRRLLAGDEALVRTLEAYLDHAGDVKRTAAALSLHRGGLYYRLRRIEEVAEVNLHDGEDRLLCHLALRLARLSGQTQG